ncbi:phage tail tape measure protein [Achromobacter xylosoxidans]|uniref:Phage tail tape measure protein n=1 Tax=Alcaligenes xylosoxydans xylosoxydans TaxID=85698 RepID=A0A0X8P509_ALCXX|nr:phage tail tape measure protein [Achromobacter xylosoxidans]AMG39986.1 phage tail tape measure protein [Achromobacter xylosoxidans]
MNDKVLGVRLTADEADLIRGFSASGAAAEQFASTTEASLGRASAASAKMGASAGQMSQAVNASAAGSQAFAQTSERFVQGLERQVQAIGKTKSELLELQAAELGVSARVAPMIAKLREQELALGTSGRALDKYGNSAAQTAAAMRGVPAQLTDIVVSLQGGQQPMTVLLQQGGQLKDMFGGVVPAAKALGSTLLGLINPYTLAAGAAVAFGIAAYQGSEDAARLNRTIQLTGNYAGVTAEKIRGMAAAAAGENGSRSKAQQAVEALVATGQISADTIQLMSSTMVTFQKVSGQSMDDISKDFAKMPEGVTKWADEHNRSLNFMSLAQWDYIRTLEETGNREGAMRETSRALHDYLGNEAPEKLGALERAWRSVKGAVDGAWESMKRVGQEQDPLEARIATLRENIALMRQRDAGPAGLNDAGRARVSNAEGALGDALNQKGLADAVAQVQGLNAAANAAAIEAAKGLDAYDKQTSKVRQLTEALEKNARLEAAIRAVDPSDVRISAKAIKDREDETRKKFLDKDAVSAGQNAISGQLAAMQAQARMREEALRAETTALEGQRAVGLLSEEAFIRRRAAAQRAALNDELEIARKQADIAGGKKQLAERERYAGRVQELEAQIARSQQQEATDIEKYQAKIRGALRATQLDITNYSETRALQESRQNNALTLGSNDRALVDSINQAQDRFRRIRDGFTDKMLREGGAGALDSQQYLQGIAEIDAAMQAQIARERGYMDERLALQGDWKNGAIRALNDWSDASANVMAQSQQVFTSLFQGMSDAVASFVVSGKANFADFAKSVLSDLARIAARQATMGMFTAVVGSLFGASSGAAAGTEAAASQVQAAGGDGIGSLIASNGWTANAKGNVYESPSLSAFSSGVYDKPQVFQFAKGAGVFAEAGPEAIMPLRRGPDGRLGVQAHGGGEGGAGPTSIQVNVYVQSDGNSKTEGPQGLEQFGREIGEFVDARCQILIAKSHRPGGASWNERNGRKG